MNDELKKDLEELQRIQACLGGSIAGAKVALNNPVLDTIEKDFNRMNEKMEQILDKIEKD